ncbi:acetoacetate decarboxylase [Halobacteriales archaeon QS_4_69_31]|nr:MAG: acetoacetate decarboxylase [Halobacteriales archaeon QS_4_69_31]
MATTTPPPGGTSAEPIELSTGETVSLPLVTEATVYGAVFSASYAGVSELLPEGLVPVRATPRRAAVTVLSVEYHRVGDDAVEPYDEVSVQFPAVPAGERAWPYASVFTHGVTEGYVWYLPVTGESATALGVDFWGYPKVVGDITHDDHVAGRRTTLAVDGEGVLTLDVGKPPTLDLSLEGASYTVKDGQLLRERLTLDGRMGLWPHTERVSLELGTHERAQRLRALDLGSRALARSYLDGEFVIGPGQRVELA